MEQLYPGLFGEEDLLDETDAPGVQTGFDIFLLKVGGRNVVQAESDR